MHQVESGFVLSKLSLFRNALLQCEIHTLANTNNPQQGLFRCRGIEWSVQKDASRKISAQSRNLGILNKSLGISGSLHVEQSRSLEFL